MGKKKGSRKSNYTTVKVHRDAITGRFVTEDYTKKHPKTTVTETIKVPKKNK